MFKIMLKYGVQDFITNLNNTAGSLQNQFLNVVTISKLKSLPQR